MLFLAALFSASSPFSAMVSSVARADDTLSAEASVLALTSGGVAPGAALRFRPDATFFQVEGRALGDQRWTGRLTLGVDLFPSLDAFDLSAGAWGGLRSAEADPASSGNGAPALTTPSGPPRLQAGLELSVLGRLGPVGAGARHAEGILVLDQTRVSEDELRLGWTAVRTVELFGAYSRLASEGEAVVHGVGAGCAIRF